MADALSDELAREAVSGDEERVRRAVEDGGAALDARGAYQKTLLHCAAEGERPELARFLVERGADLEALTSWNHTPLEWASVLNHAATADVLRDAGARLNLFAAAGLGRAADVDASFDADGHWSGAESVAMTIPREGHCERTDDRAREAEVLGTAFHAAARNGHVAVARNLLDRGASVDARGMFDATALHWAAHLGHLDAVRFLADAGADLACVDAEYGATAVGWAREGGHDDVARFLIERGAPECP